MKILYNFSIILLVCLVSLTGNAKSVYTNSFDGSFSSFVEEASFINLGKINVAPLDSIKYQMKSNSINAYSGLKFYPSSIEECEKFGLLNCHLYDLGIDDSFVMPDFVLEKIGTVNSNNDNSNCFGAAFNFHSSLAEQVTYVPGVVFHRVLSRAFIKLSEGSSLRFGDILIIRDHRDEELLQHAAVYVGGDIFFHKPGYKASYPWVYEEFDTLIIDYVNDYDLIEVFRKKDSASLKMSLDDIFL